MKSNLAAIAACAVMLGACAYPPAGPGDYHAYQTGSAQSIQFGVVESVRDVRLHGPNTGFGGATGSVVGMVAGSHVGGGSGQFVGAVVGTLLGGLVGSSMEQAATERPGIEITVMMDSGHYLSVVQEAVEPFKSGDRVRILSGRGQTRVTH
jgi:outer membrane lipoprotein SlyB